MALALTHLMKEPSMEEPFVGLSRLREAKLGTSVSAVAGLHLPAAYIRTLTRKCSAI